MILSPDDRRLAQALLVRRLGLEFPASRLADLDRSILRCWRSSGERRPADYLARLAVEPTDSPCFQLLASQVTVGETYFFRDASCFAAIERQILPALIAARLAERRPSLRIWSAGCATGEEPYSIAILLDRLLPVRTQWTITLLATDLNEAALKTARRGRYRRWSFRGVPPEIQDRYFIHQADGVLELQPKIRDMVAFAQLNLAEERYPDAIVGAGAMDLILCRNVLMYFGQEPQRAMAERLCRTLVPGGWLIVSPPEASPELLGLLEPVPFPGAIFYRKREGARRGSKAGSRRGKGIAPAPDGSRTIPPPAAPAPADGGACRKVSGGVRTVKTDAGPPPRPAPRPSLESARALADQGRLAEARRLCQAALTANRLDPEAYLLLAAICEEQGEVLDALQALRQVLYLAPHLAQAHLQMGRLLSRQGQSRRARRHIETVVRLTNAVSRDSPIPGTEGLTAGQLLDAAQAYLALASG